MTDIAIPENVSFDIAALEDSTSDVQSQNEFQTYLSFSGTEGGWTYGQAGEEISEEDEVIISAKMIFQGWIGWKGGEIVDDILVSVYTPEKMPKEEDLEPIKAKTAMDGWNKQRAVVMRVGDESMLYKTSSVGGHRFFGALTADIKKQAAQTTEFINPVVNLTQDSYEHKTYKKMFYNPTYQLIGWCNDAGELQPE